MPDIRPYSPPDRLESWKEIAAYLRRDVSTVQRWEKREGLPVHRHLHDKLGTVYAHRGELDGWLKQRRLDEDQAESESPSADPPGAVGEPARTPAPWAVEPPTAAVQPLAASGISARLGWWRLPLLLTLTAMLVTSAAVWWMRGDDDVQRLPVRFLVMPPAGTAMDVGAGQTGFAVSPNGKYVVFLAKENAGPALAVRALDSVSATMLPGTAGGYAPFWSPDSRVIGFYTDGYLKKISLAGGTPETICEAATSTNSHGATWNRDNLIVFASGARYLLKVPAAGGLATPATTIDASRGEDAHHYPAFLPDGRHFLYVATSEGPRADPDGTTLRIASLDGSATVDLIAGALRAEYVEPGYLLFGRRGVLMAQRFDPRTRRLGAESRIVARGMRVQPGQGLATFSASETGVVAYAEEAPYNQLVWVGRDGRDEGNVTPPGLYLTPRLSRDQALLAVEQHKETDLGQTGDLWVLDLARGVPTRLMTSKPTAHTSRAVWSPDNARIAVANGSRIVLREVAGDVQEALVTGSEPRPSDWSPDGRFLIYDDLGKAGDPDIFVLPLEGSREPQPWAATPFVERRARLSPDGRWLAFESNESGRAEIHVRPFPSGPGHWQVSSNGGVTVRWRGDGRELYYLAPGGRLMAVAVGPGDRFVPGPPTAYFDVRLEPERGEFWYEVSPEGKRVLLSRVLRNVSPLVLLSNWLQASERSPAASR